MAVGINKYFYPKVTHNLWITLHDTLAHANFIKVAVDTKVTHIQYKFEIVQIKHYALFYNNYNLLLWRNSSQIINYSFSEKVY